MLTFVTEPLKKCLSEPRALFSVSRSSKVTGISFAANHSAKATMTPVLPTPPLPPIVKDHALRWRGMSLCCLCHRAPPSVLRVRGSFSRKTKRERFASCAVGLALNAARRALTSGWALGSSPAGQFELHLLAVTGADFHEGVQCAGRDPAAQAVRQRAGKPPDTSAPYGGVLGSVRGAVRVSNAAASEGGQRNQPAELLIRRHCLMKRSWRLRLSPQWGLIGF